MFRRPRRGVMVGACLALACGGAADAPPADDQSSPPVGTAVAPEARPLTLDAISPGDTAAVLDLMQDANTNPAYPGFDARTAFDLFIRLAPLIPGADDALSESDT